MTMTPEQRLSRIERDVDRLSAQDSGYHLGHVYSQMLSLYGLRAFWPMSSLDGSLNAADISGQGRTLTYSGFGNPGTVGTADIPVFVISGSSATLTRTNDSALNFTTQSICFCGWVYNTTNVTNYLFAKGSSYELYLEAGGNLLFRVWNGASAYDVRQSLSLNTWSFVAGIYVPSTYSLAYVNGAYTKNNSVPASISTNTNNHVIGGVASSTFYITMFAVTGGLVNTRALDRIYQMGRNLFNV